MILVIKLLSESHYKITNKRNYKNYKKQVVNCKKADKTV